MFTVAGRGAMPPVVAQQAAALSMRILDVHQHHYVITHGVMNTAISLQTMN